MSGSVLYALSQYPVLSQTFIHSELIALQRAGMRVGVVALQGGTGVFEDALPVLGGLEAEIFRDFDHIHAHFADVGVRAVGPVADQTGRPWSVTAHAYDIFRQPGAVSDWRGLSANCKAVVTISRFHRDYLIERGLDGRRVRVLPNAADVAGLLGKAQPVRALKRVVAIGRPVEKKGFGNLIKAWSMLPEGRPELVVVGGAGMVENPPLGLILRPMLPYSQAMAELARADLLVAPCVMGKDGDMDGIPTVLVEAMALGRPVVASRLAGIPDLVWEGVTGFLVPPGDVGALAGVLGRLMVRPDELARMGAAGPVAAAGHDAGLVAAGLQEVFGRN